MDNHICFFCNSEVRLRQHIITCYLCNRWQHRICIAGIIIDQYRQAIRENTEIHFVCPPCLQEELDNLNQPVAESSSESLSVNDTNENKSSTVWRCSVRSKGCYCFATVTQKGTDFADGPQPHIHAPDITLPIRKDISAKAKAVAKDDSYRPAMEIVEREIAQIPEDEYFKAPKKMPLKRAINHYRSKFRPQEPSNLVFDIDHGFLKSGKFLVEDLRVDNERHLIFATDYQMHLLQNSRQWYMDGTFRVVPKMFHQLFSIHAFVNGESGNKQFPLAFVFMSRRQKKDYEAVFRSLMDRLRNPIVEDVILDFERATWQAVRECFPTVTIHGCAFHWSQAVYRHVQHLGLSTTYRERGPTYKYLRLFLALPFLPAGHIPTTFQKLKDAAMSDVLVQFCQYVESTWITNTVFSIPNWSVSGRTVRTNNDVEGWHQRLNVKAHHAKLGFYILVPILRREAEMVRISIESGDIDKNPSKSEKVTRKLAALTENYLNRELSTTDFLKQCTTVYAPIV